MAPKAPLRAFPEPLPLGFVLGNFDFSGAVSLANRAGRVSSRARCASRKPSTSTMQHRLGIARKTDRRAAFDRFDSRSIHDFQRRGNDSGGSDIDDGLGGVVHLVKDRQQRAHRLARAHEPDDDFGDDAHGSFGADEHAAEIVAGGVRHFAAEPNNPPSSSTTSMPSTWLVVTP